MASKPFWKKYISAEGLGLDNLASRPKVKFDIIGLFKALVRGLFLAVFTAAIVVFNSLGDAIVGVFDGISTALAAIIRSLFGLTSAFEIAILGAKLQVSAAGIASFAVGVAVVAATALVFQWGVSRLG